jgi:hypothetical protein
VLFLITVFIWFVVVDVLYLALNHFHVLKYEEGVGQWLSYHKSTDALGIHMQRDGSLSEANEDAQLKGGLQGLFRTAQMSYKLFLGKPASPDRRF